MAQSLLRTFKQCLESGKSQHHASNADLIRYRDLSTFLIDHQYASSPRDLAADALADLCEGDQQVLDRAICSGVVLFLRETMLAAGSEFDRTCLVELVRIIRELRDIPMPDRRAQFIKWIDAWYS